MKTIIEEDYEFCARHKHMLFLSGKRIMIYGASGMLGGYISKVLMKYNELNPLHKCSIITLTRKKNCKCLHDDNYVIAYTMDISLSKELDIEYDYAIYAVGYTDQKMYVQNPVEIYTANLMGLHNALEISRKARCKSFLFISSASVYGELPDIKEITEDDTGLISSFDYRYVYQESKRMAECICSSYAKQYSMDIKIVRPFHMYGPGMKFNNSNMINDFFKRAITKENIVMHSAGTAIRNLTYLRDIVWEIFLVLSSSNGDEGCGVYNLGSYNNSIQVIEFARKIAEMANIAIEYGMVSSDNPTSKNSYCPDLTKIESLNIFRIETLSLGEGIRRSLEYYSDYLIKGE